MLLPFGDWDSEAASGRERRNAQTPEETESQDKRRHHKRDEDDCVTIRACDRNVRKSYEVSLPVTITPFAIPCEPSACCGGGARVRNGHRCDNKGRCHEFTISQIINVDIPVEFGARICYKDCCSEERGRCEELND